MEEIRVRISVSANSVYPFDFFRLPACAIESGRLHSEQAVVREALALREERVITQEVKERGRARLLAELTTTPR